MKLKDLLTAHGNQKDSTALNDNLGDAYLMNHNWVYRQVREQALILGLRFTSNRFHDYDALSLTQLPKILKEKTIPYCDNVRPLREIEKQAPGVFSWSEVPPLRANYLLHETAHVIVHQLRIKFLGKDSKQRGQKSDEQRVLSVLIEEAFANACESLANADALEGVHDEFLYKNSYVMEKAPARKLIREAIQRYGRRFTFRMLFFSFLHANFVRTQMDGIDFERVLKIASQKNEVTRLSSKDTLFLKKLFKVGFDLDPAFTLFTNAFCIRLMGVKRDLMDLLQFDFMSYFNRPHYGQLLAAMANCFQEEEIKENAL